ncbi:uncharacterized protein [Centruroides vittatus]|uniref:uncharacterized protein n=1 Tax=Centruroides vittatus TaxID=120091 RepID=UPI00350F05FF
MALSVTRRISLNKAFRVVFRLFLTLCRTIFVSFLKKKSEVYKSKKNIQRHCFVPGCKTGNNVKEKRTLFSAPKDEELRKKWSKLIPRGDKIFDEYCCVCELHFDEQFIERKFKHIINGEEVTIPRDRPKLVSDAIPTIFPNLPKYLSYIPKKRPPPKERNIIPTKKRKLSHEESIRSVDDVESHIEKPFFEYFHEVNLSSMYWSKHYSVLESITTLENILQETDKMYECQGIGEITEFNELVDMVPKNILTKNSFIYCNIFRSQKCSGVANQSLKKCLSCKYVRKSLLNKISKSKKKKKTNQSNQQKKIQIFVALKEKTQYLDSYSKHGNLLFDEIKLSEGLQIKQNGYIQGFVHCGSFTTKEMKEQMCGHGLVLLFQPFVGDWIQIVGVFGTRKNVKGNILAKLLIEAIIQIEKAGLYVDSVTGDGAIWNRSMWKEFGIGVNNNVIQYRVIHPYDESRFLHFISDFPHLIKCLRNCFLKISIFNTPDGKVNLDFLKMAWKEDQKTVSLRAMPKIFKLKFISFLIILKRCV